MIGQSTAVQRTGGLAIPDRKISETIIDFGAPLLTQLDAEQTIDVVRAVFDTVITIWNANVMAMPVWGQPQFLEQLEQRLPGVGAPAEAIAICRELAARRQHYFAEDPRAVGDWNVTIDRTGCVRLHCDARIPPSLLTR